MITSLVLFWGVTISFVFQCFRRFWDELLPCLVNMHPGRRMLTGGGCLKIELLIKCLLLILNTNHHVHTALELMEQCGHFIFKTVDVQILWPSAGDLPTVNPHFWMSNLFFSVFWHQSLVLCFSLSLSLHVCFNMISISQLRWQQWLFAGGDKSHLSLYWEMCGDS